jgi:hypothetical protein
MERAINAAEFGMKYGAFLLGLGIVLASIAAAAARPRQAGHHVAHLRALVPQG